MTESNFVMANTANGPRIIKIVDHPDKVDEGKFHWTLEQLESNYIRISDSAEFMGDHYSAIPQYNLKSDIHIEGAV